MIQEYERADWMHTPEALDRLNEVWHGAQPLKEWIDAHVGVTLHSALGVLMDPRSVEGP